VEESERISFLEANLSRQLIWISAADSKASFVFAITTAMLGVLAAIAPKTVGGWTTAAAIFASFAVVLAGATLLFLSIASFPRTKGPKGSLIYCGGISQKDVVQFSEAVCELSPQSYLDDLCSQCHRNAEIADRKFAWVQRALIALYLSVIPWALALYLLYSGHR
jgi:hypothetical protein